MTALLLMIFLTGSGLTAKTLPVLTTHPMIGVLTQPKSYVPSLVKPFRVWAADNGCFNPAVSAAFSLDRYLAWLEGFAAMRAPCAFVTAPDVVADAAATWERSRTALPLIRAAGWKAALVAQNGIEDMDVARGEFDALFLGGDTAWKLSDHARAVSGEAKRRGLWVHMGRVNSLRRLEVAVDFGCDSVDGNFLGFGPDQNLPRLLAWLERLSSAPRLDLWGQA